jgi:hypothetical protein
MKKLLVVLLGRARKKLPVSFKCDCGWRHRYGLFEHLRWNEIHTIACYDCGDIYRVFQNTIVRIIPNPPHRCLISSKATGGIDSDHPYARWVTLPFPLVPAPIRGLGPDAQVPAGIGPAVLDDSLVVDVLPRDSLPDALPTMQSERPEPTAAAPPSTRIEFDKDGWRH